MFAVHSDCGREQITGRLSEAQQSSLVHPFESSASVSHGTWWIWKCQWILGNLRVKVNIYILKKIQMKNA